MSVVKACGCLGHWREKEEIGCACERREDKQAIREDARHLCVYDDRSQPNPHNAKRYAQHRPTRARSNTSYLEDSAFAVCRLATFHLQILRRQDGKYLDSRTDVRAALSCTSAS
jgi:hypothetical protein